MQKDITEGLTEQEDLQLQKILEKWANAGGGRISDKTFALFGHTIPQICVETIIFRKDPASGNVETLLLKRPEGDVVWPGMFSFPGKAMRRSDFFQGEVKPVDSVIKRIEENELENKLDGEPIFVDAPVYMSERGPTAVFCYLGKLSEDAVLPLGAVWQNVDLLEQNPAFIKSEMYCLRPVLAYFKAL